MTYFDIEQQLITQLEPLRQAGLIVQATPLIPNQWASEPGNGWVVLKWVATTLDQYSLNEATAVEKLEYQIEIRVRKLREADSLYQIINEIKHLLWGFRITKFAKPITYNSVNFLGTLNDYWIAQMNFTAYVFAGFSQSKIDYSIFPTIEQVDFYTVTEISEGSNED